ncbi:DUF1254 domain-containing protein [Streptomyces sp. NPDC048664]|uniref:DUF1254 domain-containing protein n=1 Tax=Streptomyces sp. NPDC048664 TaxID=3154505 RepID=UPI003415DC74
MNPTRRPRRWGTAVSAGVAALALSAASLTTAQASTAHTPSEPSAATAADAVKAYVYGYPLVLARATEQLSTNVAEPDPGRLRAPVNQFAKADTTPDPRFHTVVAPNVDTLYTSAWLDLKNGPLLLHVPDTKGRYFMMPMLSGWTDVFASPGTRTTGSSAGDFAITGPGWHGRLPAGVKRIKAPTETAWILGRTQFDGPSDLPAVKALARHYTLEPLRDHGHHRPPPAGHVDPTVPDTPPAARVAAMDAQTFFSQLASAMATDAPAKKDAPMVAALARLGVTPGRPFDIDAKGPATAQALRQAVPAAQKRIKSALATTGTDVNGWRESLELGHYGTDYLLRATTAWQGLGANLPQDAVYPIARTDSRGRALTGAHRYVLHFAPGHTPPVSAFWSLTMYDPSGFLVPNPIKRYEIGHDVTPKPNRDGSMDIYLQHDAPAGKRSNWLPAPSGRFSVILRMYRPKPAALDGSWTPPGITVSR